MPEVGVRSLAKLATTINSEIEEAELKGIEHYRKAGQALIEAKRRIKENGGSWLSWLKENCPEVNPRRAQRYMAMVKNDVTSHSPEKQRAAMGNGKRQRSVTQRKAKGDALPAEALEFASKEQRAEYKELVATLMERRSLGLKSRAEAVLYALRLCKARRDAA